MHGQDVGRLRKGKGDKSLGKLKKTECDQCLHVQVHVACLKEYMCTWYIHVQCTCINVGIKTTFIENLDYIRVYVRYLGSYVIHVSTWCTCFLGTLILAVLSCVHVHVYICTRTCVPDESIDSIDFECLNWYMNNVCKMVYFHVMRY